MKRRLSLRSEHLADLSPGELGSVNGGASQVANLCFALTFSACERLSIPCLTGHYPSINATCTTP